MIFFREVNYKITIDEFITYAEDEYRIGTFYLNDVDIVNGEFKSGTVIFEERFNQSDLIQCDRNNVEILMDVLKENIVKCLHEDEQCASRVTGILDEVLSGVDLTKLDEIRVLDNKMAMEEAEKLRNGESPFIMSDYTTNDYTEFEHIQESLLCHSIIDKYLGILNKLYDLEVLL